MPAVGALVADLGAKCLKVFCGAMLIASGLPGSAPLTAPRMDCLRSLGIITAPFGGAFQHLCLILCIMTLIEIGIGGYAALPSCFLIFRMGISPFLILLNKGFPIAPVICLYNCFELFRTRITTALSICVMAFTIAHVPFVRLGNLYLASLRVISPASFAVKSSRSRLALGFNIVSHLDLNIIGTRYF